MKLRTEPRQVWIKKTNGDETAEFLVDLLTPKEQLDIVDEVRKANRNKTSDLSGNELYQVKVLRIDRTIRDWKGVEDEDGQSMACTSKNKEIAYNFNRNLIDEVLDEADELADVRNATKEEEVKNSKAGLVG